MKQASIGPNRKWIIDLTRCILLAGILATGCRNTGNEEAEVHMLLMAKLGNTLGQSAFQNLKAQAALNESESDRQEFWLAMRQTVEAIPASVLTKPEQEFVKAKMELSQILKDCSNAPKYGGSLESLLSLSNAKARAKFLPVSTIERCALLGIDRDGALSYVTRLGDKTLAVITYCPIDDDLQSPSRPTMVNLIPLDLPEAPLTQDAVLKAVGLNPDRTQEVNYKMLAGKRITGEPVSTAYVKGQPKPTPKSTRYRGITTHSLEFRTYGVEFWSDTWRLE